MIAAYVMGASMVMAFVYSVVNALTMGTYHRSTCTKNVHMPIVEAKLGGISLRVGVMPTNSVHVLKDYACPFVLVT